MEYESDVNGKANEILAKADKIVGKTLTDNEKETVYTAAKMYILADVFQKAVLETANEISFDHSLKCINDALRVNADKNTIALLRNINHNICMR